MPVATDEIKTLIERVDNEAHVLLHDVSWEFYEAVLDEIGDRRRIFVTFDRGEMELMAPSFKHDDGKWDIARMISVMALELRISIRGTGSATWRRKDIERGVEPDECFYIQNYQRVKRKEEIKLPTDPPPDLILEVDVSRSSLKKQSIYAAMGVPEFWCYDNGRLSFHCLKGQAYEKSNESLAFPGLKAKILERFIKMQDTMDDADAMQAFVQWVRENLKRPS